MDFAFVIIEWWQTFQSLKMQSFKIEITKFCIAFYKLSLASENQPTKYLLRDYWWNFKELFFFFSQLYFTKISSKVEKE